MLVVVGNKFGITREYFCEHAFLVGLEGRQRPLAKFLTGEMVTELQQLVPATRATYEKYIEDSNNYEYTAEPEGGDIDSDDEEFRIDPFADGRYFTNALFFDFIEKFGRKAKTGDKASSSAYIIKPPFE